MNFFKKTLIYVISFSAMISSISLAYPIVGQEVLSNGDIATYTINSGSDGSLYLESQKTGHILDWKRKYGTTSISTDELSNPEMLHFRLEWVHGTYNGAFGRNVPVDYDSLAKDICSKVGITDSMSDLEKIRKAHDYLCSNYSYGEEGESVMGGRRRYNCHSYAEEFCNIVNAAGVETEYVGGTAEDSEGVIGTHAWNRVKVGDEWLYVDVTWDDCLSSDKYYLISYDEMSNDHSDTTNEIFIN